jgi:hypothetical protein
MVSMNMTSCKELFLHKVLTVVRPLDLGMNVE